MTIYTEKVSFMTIRFLPQLKKAKPNQQQKQKQHIHKTVSCLMFQNFNSDRSTNMKHTRKASLNL